MTGGVQVRDFKRRALCLFGGLGATAKGQRDILGHEIAGVIECDPIAAETLRKHFPERVVFEQDVRTFDYARLGPVDVILGGPPCQPFSQAGAQVGEYDPRDMIPEFIRAVGELLPEVFVMEEVWTLTWKKHEAYLNRVLRDLTLLGYIVEARVLDMSKYGIPQKRKRLFVVGVRADLGREVQWPVERECQTMAAALGWDTEEAYKRNQMAPEPARVAWDLPGYEYLDPRLDWVYQRPSTTVVGSFRPDVQAAPGYRKAGDGPRQNTPGSVVITVDEAKVLQGLPRDWEVAGNESQQRLQIGNSCPPLMTAFIVGANVSEVVR